MSQRKMNVADQNFEALPKGFTLKRLFFFHRHGERTPVSLRFTDVLPLPSWNFCKRTAVKPVENSDAKYVMQPISTSTKQAASPFAPELAPDACVLGQLTDVGATTCETLGNKLRKFYVDELKFLPANFDYRQLIYQSTDVPRAQSSARFLMAGMYPPSARPDGQSITIYSRPERDEIIYPNWNACARLKQMSQAGWHDPVLARDMVGFMV
jgi:hypothetical protein